MIRVAILGASGFVGGELLRLIAAHPRMEVAVAFGSSTAGRPVADVHPHLALAYPQMMLAVWTPDLLATTDLILAALPHGETQRLADDLLGPRHSHRRSRRRLPPRQRGGFRNLVRRTPPAA